MAAALALATFMVVVQASDQQSPLTDKEKQLADLVNQYRQDNGLSALPITNSLTKVARAHIEDLNTYHPDTETYGTGSCNLHSWSSHGTWTAVCYTGSAQAGQMWSKPREITDSYDGNGFEISSWNSREITPSAAMDVWKGSSDHSDTILQRGIFAGTIWQAMGVGIDGNYAVIWFGADEDPADLVPTPRATDHPDAECAFACLTLLPKKSEYAQGETVQFVLKKTASGSATLEDAYYEIEKKKNGQWSLYDSVDQEHWRFKTPVIESGGVSKMINWDQHRAGDQNDHAPVGSYRMKFFAPNAYEGFLAAEFAIA
ncbi:Uncharacterised protein [uncultured archaeon]|nr:Uncharacterised protein [uncultured archaeon]